MAMAAPREWVRVSRLSERLHTQGEEGYDLDMLDEDFVQRLLELEYPDHDGALQKVAFVSFLIIIQSVVLRCTFTLVEKGASIRHICLEPNSIRDQWVHQSRFI
jgi:hypothetical protein